MYLHIRLHDHAMPLIPERVRTDIETDFSRCGLGLGRGMTVLGLRSSSGRLGLLGHGGGTGERGGGREMGNGEQQKTGQER